mgnify:CR=1 FL=1
MELEQCKTHWFQRLNQTVNMGNWAASLNLKLISVVEGILNQG